jgi:phage FluMu gp28-like protein
MSGPIDIRSPRAITEEEWKALRLESIKSLPPDFDPEQPQGVLLEYQKSLLGTTALFRVTVCEKSRRTGATWAVAADAVLTAASAVSARGMDAFYIGYNLEMAREFIDTCAMWAKAFSEAAAEVEEYLFEDEPDKSIKAFRIRFASGFQIIALPSRPRSLRGMQGLVIIDEAAFHDDLADLLKAAFALLIWGGRVLVISTHNGDANAFNTLVKEAKGGTKGYGYIRFDFDDAIRDGLYRRVCLRTGEPWSVEAEAAWRTAIVREYGDAADEELFCIPREGDGAFLPAPLIEARSRQGIPVIRLKCEPEFTHWPQHLRETHIREWCERELKPLLDQCDKSLAHYLGGDYGRISDLTVLWPLAVQRNLKRQTPFVVELKTVPFDQQRQILKYICDRLPRFTGSKHDGTGLGMSTAEFAVQTYGALRNEAVMLNIPWYREHAQPLKTAFEDDMIEIPMDADTHSDLRLVAVKAGVPHVPALKSGVNKDRHGDSAVALMLAYAASRTAFVEFDYTSASTLREGRDGEDEADDLRLPQGGLY